MDIAVSAGYGSLLVAFVIAIYALGAAIYAVRKNAYAWAESARLAVISCFVLVSAAVFSLLFLLWNHEFQVAYIYQVVSTDMPLTLRLSALWGGQAGSLLFWAWLLSGVCFFTLKRNWKDDAVRLPWVVAVLAATLAFFLLMSAFIENPFLRFWFLPDGGEALSVFPPAGAEALIPQSGVGLNPLLRHLGMVLHPPFLYLGFIAFIVPFAYAVATLIAKPTDNRWLTQTRRWTLFAWVCLSIGLLLGSRWAYEVLGWGGYWGWDPVEIAALMPWLTGTAFLHSAVIEEKRGMFRRWNFILVLLTYALVVFGTFITRSGVVSSVHAFGESAVGPLFFVFIGLTLLASLGMLFWRWNALRSESILGSLLSREALFLFNNLLFMGILAACFWGVVFPMLSEVVTGTPVTVGPPFYERVTSPLFIGLYILMGIVPLSTWTRTSLTRLGTSLWKPVLLALAAPLLGSLFGLNDAVTLGVFWLLGLVVLVSLADTLLGLQKRILRTGEGFFMAVWNLAPQNRRRYGGYIVHLGIVLMGLGIIGIEVFQSQTQASVIPGESIQLEPFQLTYLDLDTFEMDDGRNIVRAEVALTLQNGDEILLHPRREIYPVLRQSVTLPAIYSTFDEDIYVLLVDWDGDQVTFKVFHNPLINWLWLGAIVLIAGTVVALWPEKRREG